MRTQCHNLTWYQSVSTTYLYYVITPIWQKHIATQSVQLEVIPGNQSCNHRIRSIEILTGSITQ
jgi:hypothetical protein